MAGFVPARYDKPEESIGIIGSLEFYMYEIERPVPMASQSESLEHAKVEGRGWVGESESAEAVKDAGPGGVTETQPVEPVQDEEPRSVMKIEPAEHAQTAGPKPDTEVEPVESSQVNEPAHAEEPVQTDQLTGSRKHTQRQDSVPVQGTTMEP